jgi:hypothetical protein
VLNDRIISEYGNERKKMWENAVVAKIEALFRHLPEATEGNHENLHPACFNPSGESGENNR